MGITAVDLTQGAGVNPSANMDRFGGSNWFDTGDTDPTTLAEAVADNDYIEFVVTPIAGYFYNATSLVFNWQRSGTGPSSVTLRSSIDGFVADIGSVTGLPESISTGNTITISGHTGLVSAVTFRLYGYAATSTGGTGGFDVASNVVNVEVNGTATRLSPTSVSSDFFRSRLTGDWGTPATWESSPVADFSSGLVSPATLAPDASSSGTTIRNAHNVTIFNTVVTTDQTVVDAGGTLTQLTNLTVADGAGDDIVVNGNMIVNGDTYGTGTELINGTMEYQAGTLNSGNITIAIGGVFNKTTPGVLGSGNLYIGYALTNNGTFNWIDGNISFGGGSLINGATGTMMVTCDKQITAVVTGAVITNNGTITKSASAGTTLFTSATGGVISNTGTINVNDGIIEVNGATNGWFDNSGTIAITSGKFFKVSNAFAMNAGSNITGAGIFQVNCCLNAIGAVSATNVLLVGGQIGGGGTLTVSGGMEFQSGAVADVNIVLDAGAVSSKTTAGIISFDAPFDPYSLTNNGTFNFLEGTLAQYRGSFINGATGNLTISSAVTWVVSNPGIRITNDGLFTISGDMTLSGGFNTVKFLNNNTLAIDGLMTIPGAFGSTGLINAATGTIKGSGTLDITSPFVNSGIIAPGASPGIITLNGEEPFSATSILNIEMNNGGVPGVGHDQVARSSNLTLAGTLNVTETGSVPAGSYTIIDLSAGSISGSFSPQNLPAGYSLTIVGNDVVLTKVPPVSLNTHYFRSITTGNWNAPGTWESSPVADFSSGVVNPATFAPNELSSGITIRNTDNVSINLAVTADQIVVDAAATLTQNASLTLANGTGDDLIVNGTWEWTNGLLATPGNAVVGNTGTLNLTTLNAKWLGANLTNNGTIDWQNGVINFFSSATLTNNGLWNITGASTTSFGDSWGTIVNNGTITKSSAGNSDFAYVQTFTNNMGATINCNAGNLRVGGAGNPVFNNVGALVFNSGAFTINGGMAFNLNAGSSVSGTGTFNNNGTLNLNVSAVFPSTMNVTSTTAINGAGDLTINSDFIIQGQISGSGILIINANSTWINGSLDRLFIVDNSRTLTINTNNTKSLHKNLTNDGTIDWQDGIIAFYNSASITNNALWNITGNSSTSYGNSSGSIHNTAMGTITKLSVGTTNFTYASPFNNSGTINFNGGTVALGGAVGNDIYKHRCIGFQYGCIYHSRRNYVQL